jgi:hypothetical protein
VGNGCLKSRRSNPGTVRQSLSLLGKLGNSARAQVQAVPASKAYRCRGGSTCYDSELPGLLPFNEENQRGLPSRKTQPQATSNSPFHRKIKRKAIGGGFYTAKGTAMQLEGRVYSLLHASIRQLWPEIAGGGQNIHIEGPERKFRYSQSELPETFNAGNDDTRFKDTVAFTKICYTQCKILHLKQYCDAKSCCHQHGCRNLIFRLLKA